MRNPPLLLLCTVFAFLLPTLLQFSIIVAYHQSTERLGLSFTNYASLQTHISRNT